MKTVLKILYFCVVIALFVTAFRVETSTKRIQYDQVGYNLGDDQRIGTVYLEYEYSNLVFFTGDFDLIYRRQKIYADTINGAVCLDDSHPGDITGILRDSTGVFLGDDLYETYYNYGFLAPAAYVVFLIILPFIVFICSAKSKRKARAEAAKKNVDEYYNKCLALEIYSVDTKADQEKLLIVAKNFGYTTLEEAIKNYHQGEEQAKVHKENKKQVELAEKRKKEYLAQQEIEKKRAEERQQYTAEKEFSERTGKKKYNSIIKEKIKALQAEYKDIEKIDPFTPFMHHKKDNWGWIGGIAEGIAGPGAGVMAAAEAHERNVNYNNAVDQYNTSLINNGYDPTVVMNAKRKKLKEIEGEIKKLEEYAAAIEKALINDDCIKSDFGKLQFTVNGSVIEDTLNLSLDVSVKVAEPVTLLDQKAIIDGSVLINVLDKNNQKVGEAYYNACDAETYILGKAGFNHSKPRSVMAVPIGQNLFDKNEKYHYEVKPNTIWTIEIC